MKRTGDAVVRLHDGAGGTYLWIVNNKAKPEELDVTLGQQWSGYSKVEMLWGDRALELHERHLHATVGALDAIVAKLVK